MANATDTKSLLEVYFPDKTFKFLLSIGSKTDPNTVREVMLLLDDMMQMEANNITYTQLRNILQTVKNDEFKTERSKFYLVIPKLAYMQARPQKNDRGKKIISFIRELATAVDTDPEYESFEEIVNAIVAYHKLHAKNKN